jgi:hypothetical protein
MNNEQKNKLGTMIIIMFWVVWVILPVAFFSTILYVAWHFISKLW